MFLNILNKLGKSLVVLCTLAFFFCGQVSFAQEVKEYGTRISDREATSNLKGNRILELESKTKGFMLPRMTTEERDLNFKGRIGKEDSGLTIFNTDIACVEYYSGLSDKWVSVCGEAPPAIVDASDICADLVRHNSENLTAGVTVPVSEAITLTFRIARIGKVAINIVSDNGYDYTANETYMSEGVYKLRLQGKGIPTNSGVDNLKIYINEQLIDTCTIPVTVNPAQVDFTFQSSQVKTVQEKVNLYDDLTGLTGYAAEFDVNVISPGQGVVMATYNHADGSTLVFRGEANFTTSGDAKIILRASGRLQTYQPSLTFNITSTNAKSGTSSLNGAQIIINTAKTKLKPICENLDQAVFGKYVQGSNLLDGDNKVVLNFEVLNSGLADLSLVSTKGGINYEFKAIEKRFAFDRSLDKTIVAVTFIPSSALLISDGVYNFRLQSRETDILDGNTCVIPISVEKPPVSYDIDCSTIKVLRPHVASQTALDREEYRVEMTANVTEVGKYSIVVNDPLGDVNYATKADAEFTELGLQTIVLYPVSASGKNEVMYSGENDQSIVHSYTFSKGTASSSEDCSFVITSGLRKVNIGFFGTVSDKELKGVLGNKKYFGPNGVFANVLDIKSNFTTDNTSSDNFDLFFKNLKKAVEKEDYDIFVLGLRNYTSGKNAKNFTKSDVTSMMNYLKTQFTDKGKFLMVLNEFASPLFGEVFIDVFDSPDVARFETNLMSYNLLSPMAKIGEPGADHPILNPRFLKMSEFQYLSLHGNLSAMREDAYFFYANTIPASKFMTVGKEGDVVNALFPKDPNTKLFYVVDNAFWRMSQGGGNYPVFDTVVYNKFIQRGHGYVLNFIVYAIDNL